MSNFAFLPSAFRDLAEASIRAEGYIEGDPRSSCFHARFALEALVHWLYRHDPALSAPYDQSLGALLHEPTFQNLLPEALFHKARAVQRQGNIAVHSRSPVRRDDALQAVKELHHLCYWLVRTYSHDSPRDGAAWRDERVPRREGEAAASRAELEALTKRLAEQSELARKRQRELDARDAELAALRTQYAEVRAAQSAVPDTHDYSEAETRRYLIDVDLRRAGWPLDGRHDREYEVAGMPTKSGTGRADYVLWGDDGRPLAVVEAKRSTVDADRGRRQATLYADCLEEMHGRRPVIFTTNGYETYLWDDLSYPPRLVAGFYKKDELARLILRRTERKSLDVADIKGEIAGRYYQRRAIGSIAAHFAQSRRKALLVMATGSGKTRVAVALVDLLQRAGWVKRALFLADRVSLVDQAVRAFKTHLPESSPVNLVTERNADGRVYVSTYPTMMGLIDTTDGGEERFGVGHFDIVIIDEAHRSVYQKYGAIFRYFDSLLVGLTATPREQVDRNTYELFDLEDGVPTDAYELSKAVEDGFLVPFQAEQIDLTFPKHGIKYDGLSDAEKERWEGLDWGDAGDEGAPPKKVNAKAINTWLFNSDTVDTALRHLMERGHTVDGGDRLAKTIIFARNHEHARFVRERFDHHYPQYNGHFAEVVDTYDRQAQDLIDKFSHKDRAPHIAVSVDMLDTGIDVPEVANLVFFKPVYSKIRFWQMIGRGTRLCPDLFGPGDDKHDFRIFDFCFNFDFFGEKPDGIDGGETVPLGTRLFRTRIDLLGLIAAHPELDADSTLKESLIGTLHSEVAAMSRDNFIVRMHYRAVEQYRDRAVWSDLSSSDRHTLKHEVAGLPSRAPSDAIETRLFDLVILRMQVAHVEGDVGSFERSRNRVVEIATFLVQRRSRVPVVAANREYLSAIRDDAFWHGVGLGALEDLRQRVRKLAILFDTERRKGVYTDFQDELMGVREVENVLVPSMTGEQYEKKVADYLRNHLDHIVIHRLRTNQPLTATDLEGLEHTLVEIGDGQGESLLSGLLSRSGSPSVAYFVRSLVGMDGSAAREAFAEFLADRSLTAPQIRFVEMVIDQLTARGVMKASALYEAPFIDLHSGGPEALFAGRETVVEGIFETLRNIHSSLDRQAT